MKKIDITTYSFFQDEIRDMLIEKLNIDKSKYDAWLEVHTTTILPSIHLSVMKKPGDPPLTSETTDVK
jgi:hypothetical protein